VNECTLPTSRRLESETVLHIKLDFTNRVVPWHRGGGRGYNHVLPSRAPGGGESEYGAVVEWWEN
jgi:hypothetical protein